MPATVLTALDDVSGWANDVSAEALEHRRRLLDSGESDGKVLATLDRIERAARMLQVQAAPER